jgi:predicted RNA-binding protein with TRAM domain
LKYQPAIEDAGLEDNGSGSRGPKKFGGPRPFRLTPVKVGDEYDVRVESMSRRGDSGVAKIQGLVVFVAGAKVGDSLRIKITKVGSGFAVGEVTGKAGMSLEGEAETSGDIDE